MTAENCFSSAVRRSAGMVLKRGVSASSSASQRLPGAAGEATWRLGRLVETNHLRICRYDVIKQALVEAIQTGDVVMVVEPNGAWAIQQ